MREFVSLIHCFLCAAARIQALRDRLAELETTFKSLAEANNLSEADLQALMAQVEDTKAAEARVAAAEDEDEDETDPVEDEDAEDAANLAALDAARRRAAAGAAAAMDRKRVASAPALPPRAAAPADDDDSDELDAATAADRDARMRVIAAHTAELDRRIREIKEKEELRARYEAEYQENEKLLAEVQAQYAQVSADLEILNSVARANVDGQSPAANTDTDHLYDGDDASDDGKDDYVKVEHADIPATAASMEAILRQSHLARQSASAAQRAADRRLESNQRAASAGAQSGSGSAGAAAAAAAAAADEPIRPDDMLKFLRTATGLDRMTVLSVVEHFSKFVMDGKVYVARFCSTL